MGNLQKSKATLTIPQLRQSNDLSLVYVHIPFCKYKCHFCCFCRRYNNDFLALKELKTPYIKALLKELAVKSFCSEKNRKTKLKAIYFGGGTPSLLSVKELDKIISSILSCSGQNRSDIVEISIEATPDSLTDQKVRGLKSIGFNRISIGVQTFNNKILSGLNRDHRAKDIYSSYDRIRKVGFKNVNLDLLCNFPGQTFSECKDDLKIAVSMEPDHMSYATLLPVPGPLFDKSTNIIEKKIFNPYRMNLIAGNLDLILHAYDYLSNNGYPNYFHTYFAKKGKEFLSELIFVFCVPFMGLGAGAIGWDGMNSINIKEYIKNPLSQTKALLSNDKPFYWSLLRAIYLQLLLPEGINIDYFNDRFNCDLEKIISNPDRFLNYSRLNKKYNFWPSHDYNKSLKTFKKMIRKDVIEKYKGCIRIVPKKRFSPEGLGIYVNEVYAQQNITNNLSE
ncbi:MAG: coproporphyrinogen III oxidase family protein [Candidatus Omnitrophica bacterium]|nr:coproporphyrinogen III oxidase family protein [Candidatus Omnitrophota bacterium]